MRWIWLAIGALAACGSSSGMGADVDAGDGDGGGKTDDATHADARADARGSPDAGGLVVVPDPGPPDFPATAGTVSVTIRTGPGDNDGANGHLVDLCLRAGNGSCYRLDAADVDDFRVGERDVYHFYGVNLARSAIDRVELRSVSGGDDMFHPDCLQVELDGETVYCQDNLTVKLGTGGGGEVTTYRDPQGLHLGCKSCWADELTHGPIIGAVEPTLARIWVRTDATRAVALRMTDDPTASLATAPTVDWLYPTPERDFAGVLTARGLRAGTRYRYAVEVDGKLHAGHGLTAAPPAGKPTRWSFAFGSCTRLESQPIFSQIASVAPDLFLFLGDNHYGNTHDLDSLRWFYRWAHERPARAAMQMVTPTIAIWDDHDFVGNNTEGSSPGRETALRAFKEYWANPSAGTAATPGIFFRYRYADVEFFMVDDRYYRGIDDDVLGPAQTAWLLDAMEQSTATFKIIACGSQFTANGSSDSWAAYRAVRDRLFDQLVIRHIEGVVLIDGDVHRAELRKIPRKAAHGYDLPELTSSPLANTNFDCHPDESSEKDLVFCEDSGTYFIQVQVDTTLADPVLDVTVHNASGAVKSELIIKRSQLEL